MAINLSCFNYCFCSNIRIFWPTTLINFKVLWGRSEKALSRLQDRMSHWSLKVKQFEQKLNRFHFWDSFTAKKSLEKDSANIWFQTSKARQFPSLNCSGEPFQPHAQHRMWTDTDKLKIGKIKCDIVYWSEVRSSIGRSFKSKQDLQDLWNPWQIQLI